MRGLFSSLVKPIRPFLLMALACASSPAANAQTEAATGPQSIIYFPTAPKLLATEGATGTKIISGVIHYRFSAKVKERVPDGKSNSSRPALAEKGDFLYGVPVQTRIGVTGFHSWIWCSPKLQKKWIARCFETGKPPTTMKNVTSPLLFDQSIQAYPHRVPEFQAERSDEQFSLPITADCYITKWKKKSLFLGCTLAAGDQIGGGYAFDIKRRPDGTVHFSLGGARFVVHQRDEGFTLTQETAFSDNSSAIFRDVPMDPWETEG